jgi:hypothetical protein
MNQNLGQLGKRTVKFRGHRQPLSKTSSKTLWICNLGLAPWIFFGCWILGLGFSTPAIAALTRGLSAPDQFDLLTLAPVTSTRPVRLAPDSSSFQLNQSGPNSTKPELSGANWTKTAFSPHAAPVNSVNKRSKFPGVGPRDLPQLRWLKISFVIIHSCFVIPHLRSLTDAYRRLRKVCQPAPDLRPPIPAIAITPMLS